MIQFYRVWEGFLLYSQSEFYIEEKSLNSYFEKISLYYSNWNYDETIPNFI